jgi:hypothetical protein
MYYNHDTLAKLSKRATYEIDFAKLGSRSVKTLVKSLRTGILQSTTGQVATYHAIIIDHLKLPAIAFSKRGRYWDRLFIRNAPVSYKEGLKEWWNLDRVTYRMENPSEWQELCETPWRKQATVEPDWGRLHSMSIDILSTKNLDVFENIVAKSITNESYLNKINEVIRLIEAGTTLNVVYSGA